MHRVEVAREASGPVTELYVDANGALSRKQALAFAVELPLCCAVVPLRHLEYFHDHVRIAQMFFDSVLDPVGGALRPDLTRPGNGLELRRADAERYAI